MKFDFSVPTPSGSQAFEVHAGTTLFFVGANGSGKTRLAVQIEESLGDIAHRISAHRALSLNPAVPKVSERAAIRGLKYGNIGDGASLHNRRGNRWGNKAAIQLLNDYDFLIQALFAEQANTALQTHQNARASQPHDARATKFERLNEIWGRVLPHRALVITGDDICVSVPGTSDIYEAREMSDGERAVFYLIGQTLIASASSLIIFDEPELHIHRGILARLWDELEAARPDCGMVVISHDLEFVASRGGQTFVLKDYAATEGWTVEAVPEDSGFSEDITTLILGSRKPILFVEGEANSLDQAIYRACYDEWTIIPRGSCEEVIHAVVTMRANASLTRVMCAGIVDADAYETTETTFLQGKGIAILPVSEIENLFMLPDVIEAVCLVDGREGDDLTSKRDSLVSELFEHAEKSDNQVSSVMRYCRRRIDRTLKKIDLSEASDVVSLASKYSAETNALDIAALATVACQAIQKAIVGRNAPDLLKWYDNKGILSIACKAKDTRKDLFEQWIVRALKNNSVPALSKALKNHLPQLTAR